MSERKESKCPTCYHGYLPLDQKARSAIRNKENVNWNNGDWLVCTDCDGTGTFIVYEHLVVSSVIIPVDGLRK